MTPITVDNLVAAGYKRFTDSFERDKMPDWYVDSFQKRFRDERGTRYFITVAVHKTPLNVLLQSPQLPDFMFSPSEQFIIDEEDNRINISLLLGEDSTIEWMEAQFLNLWMFYGYYYEKD